MTSATKITILIGVIIAAAAALVAQFVTVIQAGYESGAYTSNTGELTINQLVGQNFEARYDNLAGISVQFATYSNRNNTGIITLRLRESTESAADLRVATIPAQNLRDNQHHRFTFEPIPDSRGRRFFFLLTADSPPGAAITVDLNTQDPYHNGTAFWVRDVPPHATTPAIINAGGKPTADLAFGLHYEVPLRSAVMNEARDAARTFVATWEERRSTYVLWLELIIPAVLFLVLIVGLQRQIGSFKMLTPKVVITTLVLLFIIAVGFRTFYAVGLPVTNDEGNYLYDALILREGRLAGGDGYVKAPLVIAWIAIWQTMLGNTVMAGRAASIVAGALTIFPLYAMGTLMLHRRAGLIAAAAWALLGAPAVFNIYIHTQSLALFFATAGLAILWLALRSRQGALSMRSLLLSITAGALIGLGVASRKSVLALGLSLLAIIAIEARTWRQRLTHVLAVGVGFTAVVALFLIIATQVYGVQGFWEAIGLNSAEDGITATDPAEADQVRAYSLRGMTPFFRESLPLILLGTVGLGLMLEGVIRLVVQRLQKAPLQRARAILFDYLLPKVIWLVPAAAFAWAWWFFREYEGGIFVEIGGMAWLWPAMAVASAVVALWPRASDEQMPTPQPSESPLVAKSTQPPVNTIQRPRDARLLTVALEPQSRPTLRTYLVASLVPTLWFAGLVIFYVNWIKFHANYIIEFLIPLALLAGPGAYAAWHRLRTDDQFTHHHPLLTIGRRATSIAFLAVLLWAAYLSNLITYTYEHTGTFQQDSLKEAAVWARQNIPFTNPIFTGAAAVPYLSGHRVALDIAHPRWYAYEFTRKDPDRLNVFLPPAERMVEAFRSAQWVLLERQTGFSFLMEYSEIERGIEKEFIEVHTVENGSNTLRFYRRVTGNQ